MKTARKRNGKHYQMRLEAIRTDAGTQTRAQIDETTVADYAEAMIRGDKFPPVVVFQNNGERILADGFHRVRAARKARFDTIATDIRQGNRTDALKYALQANHAHGLRRTSQDKRYAVGVALREFANLSDRAIADMCGVSHSSVGIVRRQLDDSTSSDTRTGMDGKVRRLPAKPVAQRNGETLQVIVHDAADKRVTAAVLKIAESLAGIETAIRRVVSEHPNKRAVVRGFIAKVRSDLADLEKEMAPGK